MAVALLMTGGLVGCGDDPTAPEPGNLAVIVAGLPAGAQPALTVTGPNGYNVQLTTSDTLTALRPGAYTIAASPVTTAGGRFAPTPATQTITVSSGATARAGDIHYAVVTGGLIVTVLGLPAGAQGSLTVTGPNAFSQTVSRTDTLELLEPGTYTIAAADVQASGRTYRPDPATQPATVSASLTYADATVAYGPGTGRLDLTIAGLPPGTDASVTVTGPSGFARTVASTTTLQNLEPGIFTIAAAIVGSDLTTYTPSPASQTVDVTDVAPAAATVAYGNAPLVLDRVLVADGLTAPVFLTSPDGDPRQFIVERNGRVRVVVNGTMLPQPFLEISSRVNFSGERGMLSIAFAPDYATSGTFFAYYVNLAGDVVVERFWSIPGENVAGGSLGVVIVIPHRGPNHHGGQIAFGLDGMLYVAPGDGGCCGDPPNNAQNMGTLLGKILRIDVRTHPYTVPASNPFVGQAFARPEIWASGLRNPWRFSFDPVGEKLYIGDVGQDTREEVNVTAATLGGSNYGWRLMEGTACYNPSTGCNPSGQLTLPTLEYLHTQGCSVTGGYVYRGAAIPELTGHYLYADYCPGWVRSFRVTETGTATDHHAWPGLTLPWIVSFGRDGKGELYMIAADAVWRIVRP